jgi:hypothetical protein
MREGVTNIVMLDVDSFNVPALHSSFHAFPHSLLPSFTVLKSC